MIQEVRGRRRTLLRMVVDERRGWFQFEARDWRIQNEPQALVTWPCLRFFGALAADSAPIHVPSSPFSAGDGRFLELRLCFYERSDNLPADQIPSFLI